MKKLILIFLITLFSHTSIGDSYCEILKKINMSDPAKCPSSSVTTYNVQGTGGTALSGAAATSYDDNGSTASEAKRKADAKKAEEF